MAKRNDQKKSPTDWRRQAHEIADSLAIAFILAMVIRHFVLEVFKIPTKSMEPTLIGDPVYGDKILVNKYAYDFRDPHRWDVVVFKYPLDTARNYIKRLVGLPGEAIRVRDGDVYIDGKIARKPWSVQEALWRRRVHSEEAAFWEPDDPRYWKLKDGDFAVDCETSTAPEYAEYRREILAYDEQEFSDRQRFRRITTSDILMQFLLVPHNLAGTVHVAIDVKTVGDFSQPVDQWNVALPVAEEGAPEVFRSGNLVLKGEPYRLRRDAPSLVQVANVDRTLIIRVNEREVGRLDYEPEKSITQWIGYGSEARVRLGCKGGHVDFRRPSIFVDVYYTDNPDRYAVRDPYAIKPDQFFVMGDNSANSNDSRYWETVPRSYLVGEAFLVLWPLGRMKIVR